MGLRLGALISRGLQGVAGLALLLASIVLETDGQALAQIAEEASGPITGEMLPSTEFDAQDLNAPILLQAETITYDREKGVWIAEGNVEATQNGRSVRADRVTYNDASGKMVAEGSVQVMDPGMATIFADRVEIDGPLRAGIIEGFRLVFSENTRLAAAQAQRTEDGVTVLEKAVFSPCEVCQGDGSPLWQLKAGRVIHDENRKSISYRHARLEVYGLPLLYMPYFSHPDPTVTRKSGFLTPGFGNSTELGNLFQIPYFVNLQPNMDLTLSPLITTREGLVMQSQFRHRTRQGRYQVEGSIANARDFDDQAQQLSGRKIRGHLFGNGHFVLDERRQWGYDLQLSTDDTYLRRFNISEIDRLTTNAYVRQLNPKGGYTLYNAYYFDGLRATDTDTTTPIVPALVEHRSQFKDPLTGGSFALEANLLSLFRTASADNDPTTNAIDTQRLSLATTWSRPSTSRWGDVLTLVAMGRSDLYYTRDNEIVTDAVAGLVEERNITETRFLGAVGVDWRWPFVGGNGTVRHVIEPIAQVIYSPNGGNPDDIPNEDSQSFEFDDTNLFALNRFAGLDRWEEGGRANLGMRFASYGQNVSAGVLLGQTLRWKEQTEFPTGSGLEGTRSDYVGRVSIQAGPYLDVTHRFRLDREDLGFARNEIDVNLNTTYVGLKAGYLSLEEQLADTELLPREEIRLEGRLRITENWQARLSGRRDLESDEMINNSAGLFYQNDCTQFEAAYGRTFTRDRDVEPETFVIFRVRLRNSRSG